MCLFVNMLWFEHLKEIQFKRDFYFHPFLNRL